MERYFNNPIIAPINEWEYNGTFNPAAIKIGKKVYIIYRQISKNNISTLGLAISDGYEILDRLDYPIYLPRESFDVLPAYNGEINPIKSTKHLKVKYKYISGFSYFGVEDPRATIIDGEIYLTYVAFNGVELPCVAISKIKVNDFLKERWDCWEKPVVISPRKIISKSGIIFPRKINGKYLAFHRIFPHIWGDYIKNLDEFWNGRILFGKPMIKIRPDKWDSRKVIPGAPPIETNFGWVFIYGGVSGWDDEFYKLGYTPEMFKVNDGYRYKVGIMVLDKKNPEKILFRCEEPLLQPETWYELYERAKPNVVYATGAVKIKDKILVYYGASDYFVGVATLEINLLKELINDEKSIGKSNIKARCKKILGRLRSIKPIRRKKRRKKNYAL